MQIPQSLLKLFIAGSNDLAPVFPEIGVDPASLAGCRSDRTSGRTIDTIWRLGPAARSIRKSKRGSRDPIAPYDTRQDPTTSDGRLAY